MSHQTTSNCPICGNRADLKVGVTPDTAEPIYGGQCERCGRIRVTQHVLDDLRSRQKLHLLSAFFRRCASSGPPLINLDNVDELLGSMPQLRTVPEKLNGLLRLLVESTLPPGTPVSFTAERDYPLVYATNGQEANFLLAQLSKRGLVEGIAGIGNIFVTAAGYERIEELDAASYKTTRNAFVAMWFDESRNFIYNEAIEPAIRDAGYQSIRIDKTEHVNRIDDEIIAQIRQSRFLVADFSGQRAGVYYEAGFMHGLGRNVHWMVQKSDLANVHFDTRQYNFIDYDSQADARIRLYNRIVAVEGKGPGPAIREHTLQSKAHD
jgi:hypothetical protein